MTATTIDQTCGNNDDPVLMINSKNLENLWICTICIDYANYGVVRRPVLFNYKIITIIIRINFMIRISDEDYQMVDVEMKRFEKVF